MPKEDCYICPHPSSEQEAWMLCRRDYDTLEELRDWAWRQRHHIEEPREFLALSGAVYAMDCILEREVFGCIIRLSWEQRHSDEDGFQEGSSCDLIISDEGIELQKMLVFSGAFGSDHETETSATLTPDGDFPDQRVQEWIRDCNRIEGSFSTTIDGLRIE